MCSSKGEYEVNIEEEANKKKIKKYVALGIVMLLVLVGMATVGYTYYVRGGRVACMNSDSILIEGFQCERIVKFPPMTADEKFKFGNLELE